MDDGGWVELDWDAGKVLGAEFVQRYRFSQGIGPEDWPAIVVPAPSVTFDLGPVFAGEVGGSFAAGSRAVAAVVLATLRACTQWWETVVFHDWVHPSSLFRPHSVDEPEEVAGWQFGGLFPNGDYTIFIGRDDAFGLFGDCWEQSLCVFGEPAVAAFTASNTVLTNILRRSGPPG